MNVISQFSTHLIFFSLILFASCSEPKPKFESLDGLQDVNGTSIYLQTFGRGEPLLVIHGGPGLSHDYMESHLMDLAKNHMLIFYDQRGCGESSKDLDSTNVSLNHFITDIDEIRKLINFNPSIAAINACLTNTPFLAC